MPHRHHRARAVSPAATDATAAALPSITASYPYVAAAASPAAAASQPVLFFGHGFSQPFFMVLVLAAVFFGLVLLTCAGFFFRKCTKQRMATDETDQLKRPAFSIQSDSLDAADLLPPEKAALEPPAYRPGTAHSAHDLSPGLAGQPIFSCVMDFAPSQDDELQLHVGDHVRILEYFDDGWCMGERADGKIPRGVFPRNVISDRPVTLSAPPRPSASPSPDSKSTGVSTPDIPQTPLPAAVKMEARHIF